MVGKKFDTAMSQSFNQMNKQDKGYSRENNGR